MLQLHDSDHIEATHAHMQSPQARCQSGSQTELGERGANPELDGAAAATAALRSPQAKLGHSAAASHLHHANNHSIMHQLDLHAGVTIDALDQHPAGSAASRARRSGRALPSETERVEPIITAAAAAAAVAEAATPAAAAVAAVSACSCKTTSTSQCSCVRSCGATRSLESTTALAPTPAPAPMPGGPSHGRVPSKSKVHLQVVTDPLLMTNGAAEGQSQEKRSTRHSAAADALPSPLMFQMDLTTPAASPSPTPDAHAGRRSASASVASGASSSGCSAQSTADSSRRSHSDVSDASNRPSIFLSGGWGDTITSFDPTQSHSKHLNAELMQLQQQQSLSQQHPSFGQQQLQHASVSSTLLPGASPTSPDLGGVMPASTSSTESTSMHAKTRSLPPRTRSCIMPVALKTTLGEDGSLSNSNSDLTAYRTLHRGSGVLFPRASPVGGVLQPQGQSAQQHASSITASLCLSSSAAQQSVQQQLLSAATAMATSAEGAKALQWEALQALDFPPPPPLPLMAMRDSNAAQQQQDGSFDRRSFGHATARPAVRTLQSYQSHPGAGNGSHGGFGTDARVQGFHTPNQPASRRVQHRSTLNREQMQQLMFNGQQQQQAFQPDFRQTDKEWSPPSMHRTNSEAEKELERWQAERERSAAAAAAGDTILSGASRRAARRERQRDADEGALFEMDM